MTLRVIAAFALATLTFSATAYADQTGAPDQSKQNSQDKLVCKSELRTGTRFKERTCKSLQEWEAMREQHRRVASDLVDRPLVNGVKSN